MKVYIVSLVFIKSMGQQFSVQNSVGIMRAASPEDAFQTIARREQLKFPDHRIIERVIVETTEIDLDMYGE